MAIKVSESNLHWNYFLALEKDMDTVSRFIEFFRNNFNVYSIELSHLLFAAASEIDVVAKALCAVVDPGRPAGNILDYRRILTEHVPELATEKVYISRYGLTLDPWSSWRKKKTIENPLWWRAYNQVKHERNEHFDQANLKNALNALGALLIIVFHYNRAKLQRDWPHPRPLRNKDVTAVLLPKSSLLRLADNYYFDNLVV